MPKSLLEEYGVEPPPQGGATPAPQESLVEKFGVTPPPGTLGDVGRAFARGMAGAVQSYYSQLNRLGGDTRPQIEGLSTDIKGITESMTPGGRARLEGDIIGPTPLSSIGLKAVEAAPSFIQSAAAGGPISGAMSRLGAGEAVTAAAARAGASPTVAGRVGQIAEMAPLGVVEGLQAGGSASVQAGQTVRDAPAEQLLIHPAFNEELNKLDPNLPFAQRMAAARETLALRAEKEAFDLTALSTGGIGVLTAGGGLGVFARKAAGKESADLAGEGLLRTMRRGAQEEALQEAPQSAGEQLIQNFVTQRNADQGQALFEGVPTAAFEGAVVGGVLGGAAGGAGSLLQRKPDEGGQPQPGQPPGQPPGSQPSLDGEPPPGSEPGTEGMGGVEPAGPVNWGPATPGTWGQPNSGVEGVEGEPPAAGPGAPAGGAPQPPMAPPVDPNAGPVSAGVAAGQQSGAIPTNPIGGPVDTPQAPEPGQPGAPTGPGTPAGSDDKAAAEKSAALTALQQFMAQLPQGTEIPPESPTAKRIQFLVNEAVARGATPDEISMITGQTPAAFPPAVPSGTGSPAPAGGPGTLPGALSPPSGEPASPAGGPGTIEGDGRVEGQGQGQEAPAPGLLGPEGAPASPNVPENPEGEAGAPTGLEPGAPQPPTDYAGRVQARIDGITQADNIDSVLFTFADELADAETSGESQSAVEQAARERLMALKGASDAGDASINVEMLAMLRDAFASDESFPGQARLVALIDEIIGAPQAPAGAGAAQGIEPPDVGAPGSSPTPAGGAPTGPGTPAGGAQSPEAPTAPGGDTVDTGAHGASTSPENDLPEPTDAQIEAGNYKKGKVNLNGLEISIENPSGSTRSGTDPSGKAWQTVMTDHYGYIRRTEGADGALRAFVKAGTPLDYSGPVFVVNQRNPDTGEFDEHKAMIGYAGRADAVRAYHQHYEDGWNGAESVVEMSFDEFKDWARNGDLSQRLGPRAEGEQDGGDGAGTAVGGEQDTGGDPGASQTETEAEIEAGDDTEDGVEPEDGDDAGGEIDWGPEGKPGPGTPAGGEQDPKKPKKPRENPYADLEGVQVELEVEVEEGDQRATMSMDAAEAMREMDRRMKSLAALARCLQK